MEENKNNNKFVWIFGSILLCIIIIMFIPSLLDSKEKLDTAKLEQKLIQEGKSTSSNAIADEIIEILKNRNEIELDNYLTKDFIYIDNNNYENKSVSNFWKDIKYYTGNYYLERRENSIKDEETYWVYWDIPEGITQDQYSQYSLQKIYIYMRKVVEREEITYKIYKIILKNNT